MSETNGLDEAGMGRFMDQVFGLWVEPELERRREAGGLPDGFHLAAVQVILKIGEESEVRLNDEAEIVGEATVERSVEKGERLELSPDQIRLVGPPAKDANAAHVTMLRVGSSNRWKVTFDFRYNASIASDHLAGAEEFLEAAAASLESGLLRPFVADLFTATERAAKGLLVQLPHEAFLKSSSHDLYRNEFNRWGGKRGLAEQEHVDLLNKLFELRNDARYGLEPLGLTHEDAQAMLATARELVETVKERAPEPRSSLPKELQAPEEAEE